MSDFRIHVFNHPTLHIINTYCIPIEPLCQPEAIVRTNIIFVFKALMVGLGKPIGKRMMTI